MRVCIPPKNHIREILTVNRFQSLGGSQMNDTIFPVYYSFLTCWIFVKFLWFSNKIEHKIFKFGAYIYVLRKLKFLLKNISWTWHQKLCQKISTGMLNLIETINTLDHSTMIVSIRFSMSVLMMMNGQIPLPKKSLGFFRHLRPTLLHNAAAKMKKYHFKKNTS